MKVLRHPNGIKPSGNHVADADNTRHFDFFRLLPDELIHALFQVLSVQDLVSISHTCKRLYAFSLSEELWKDIYTTSASIRPWRGTWRKSMLRSEGSRGIHVGDVYSDLLFKPYMNGQIDLDQFLPRKNSNLIPRYKDLSLSEFEVHYTHNPFILTEPVKSWPAMSSWSVESLLERYGQVSFRAECLDWPLQQYIDYMRNNQDESPLYLFDSHFAQKTEQAGHSMADDYTIPECFDQDAFKILDKERPDHRWLIMGSAKSGSTFHKDPNGTCAWNAVTTGSKLWIMFPPDCPPPGVYVSADEAEVTSPLSIAEWLLTFHKEARHTRGFLEGVCHAGEILYVPSGWWHLVVNLEECVAVTQNFVPRAYIGKVLKFLRDKHDQVSGFQKSVRAFELFDARLREEYPDVWEAAMKAENRPSQWEALKNSDEPSFCFGFDADSD